MKKKIFFCISRHPKLFFWIFLLHNQPSVASDKVNLWVGANISVCQLENPMSGKLSQFENSAKYHTLTANPLYGGIPGSITMISSAPSACTLVISKPQMIQSPESFSPTMIGTSQTKGYVVGVNNLSELTNISTSGILGSGNIGYTAKSPGIDTIYIIPSLTMKNPSTPFPAGNYLVQITATVFSSCLTPILC
jgi:hypothetical protein